jgi:hypothetical protein
MKGMLRPLFDARAMGREVTLRLAGCDSVTGHLVSLTNWQDIPGWKVRIVQKHRGGGLPDLPWDIAGDAIVAVAWPGGAP